MKQVSISFLKKEAKLLRKHNLNIKNHNDSLNELSKKYGFDKWQDLIDKCHLNLESNPIVENVSLIQDETNPINDSIKSDIKIGASTLEQFIEYIKQNYLYFLKIENGNFWSILNYLKSLIIVDNDSNEEKIHNIYPLVEYSLICYYSMKSFKCINFDEIFDLINPESKLKYEAFISNNPEILSLFESLNIEPSDYFNIIDPGFNSNGLGTHSFHGILISESGFKKHYQNFMSIRKIAKLFRIFREIRALTINQNIDEAILNWLNDYNNVNRYVHFGIVVHMPSRSYIRKNYINFINSKEYIKAEDFHAQIINYLYQNK